MQLELGLEFEQTGSESPFVPTSNALEVKKLIEQTPPAGVSVLFSLQKSGTTRALKWATAASGNSRARFYTALEPEESALGASTDLCRFFAGKGMKTFANPTIGSNLDMVAEAILLGGLQCVVFEHLEVQPDHFQRQIVMLSQKVKALCGQTRFIVQHDISVVASLKLDEKLAAHASRQLVLEKGPEPQEQFAIFLQGLPKKASTEIARMMAAPIRDSTVRAMCTEIITACNGNVQRLEAEAYRLRNLFIDEDDPRPFDAVQFAARACSISDMMRPMDVFPLRPDRKKKYLLLSSSSKRNKPQIATPD